MAKHFLSLLDVTPDDLSRTLALAAELKAGRRAGRASPHASALAGRHVGLLFEKPSLRTRVTFTIGVGELGGSIVDIPSDVMHADREPLHDVARNLERWVDAVVIRTFAQGRLSIFTGVGARPAHRQCAVGRGTSLSGAGRHADAAGAVGLGRRPHHRLRGRRQQRRHLARACRR